MTQAEGTGRTVEEAIERALQTLGASREDVEVEIVQEPRPALLGFGGREARVRLTPKTTAGEASRQFTQAVLQHMGLPADILLEESPEQIALTLHGGHAEAVVGRHGRTLDALELLVSLHVHRRYGHRVPLVLDAAGYRDRQERMLVEAARQAAARAVREGTPITLDPMSPRDRRTVHLALHDDPHVTTASEGEGEDRRVVIFPGEGGGAGGRPGPPDEPDETDDLD